MHPQRSTHTTDPTQTQPNERTDDGDNERCDRRGGPDAYPHGDAGRVGQPPCDHRLKLRDTFGRRGDEVGHAGCSCGQCNGNPASNDQCRPVVQLFHLVAKSVGGWGDANAHAHTGRPDCFVHNDHTVVWLLPHLFGCCGVHANHPRHTRCDDGDKAHSGTTEQTLCSKPHTHHCLRRVCCRLRCVTARHCGGGAVELQSQRKHAVF